MTYATSFAFDSVALVESLPPGDLRTGRDLFETVLAPASVADPGFVSEYYTVQSRSEFMGALANIELVARTYGRSPILHIEAHGDARGIQLASGELVAWEQVAPSFSRINHISQMNLLVVAAMCHGWHMVEILRPTDRAPAFGVVGTPTPVPAGALYDSMVRFYTRLVGPGHDLRRALDDAHCGAPISGWAFKMEGAELWLCRVFREYLQSLTTIETQDQRVARLVADVARAQSLDVTQTMQLRADAHRFLSNHDAWFNYYRDRFLMLDLFPENARRFPLRLVDCSDAAT